MGSEIEAPQDGHDPSIDTPQDGLGDASQDGHGASDDSLQDGRDPDIRSVTPPSGTLLLPFIEQAPPSRYVYVDDNSDKEGTYAALVRLATATLATSPVATRTNANREVIVISDHESLTASKFAASPSIIEISDLDDEYAVSDNELTDTVILDKVYTPLVFPDSDDEYIVLDIELNDAIIAELDRIC